VNTVNISLSKALPLASMNHAIGDFMKYAWVYLFHRNYTPNFSKDESHGLHISIVRQKTGPGIPSKLRSGDSSHSSCFYMPMAFLICREWLQEQLGEVLSVNTQGNGEYGIFKGPIRLK